MTVHDQMKVNAETIKETVSALDVGNALGLEIRNGRCRCPIHGGRDFNCVLYGGERGFFCHVCKSGGDVIKLVQRSNPDMSFTDVLRWFNGTFGLGMNIDSHADENRLKQAKNRFERKTEKRKWKEQYRSIVYEMYLNILDAIRRAETIRDENQPKRYCDGWDKEFADAVGILPELNRYADYFGIESLVSKK